ncbi:hypothetical protein PTSG_03011 [Salpingoeca rosetta]|uniref:Cullin N-terminal domain-containing protein n=1 Tax=Salpingoeca rosetta (strain ATCC 50818 / BSB-021) TaxID=946362 RepID=F2U403_SALR5|nr:uncharacterized protein PTSG_03011 [Salpingoeca rosetta]EGD82347.1 hypothetical protein PTSG_03011 [Salpingoeca rosetta]|eukprot:XP_004996530.1 hypothetical protein PTSG_03011 [Salpingoeca rosetta]
MDVKHKQATHQAQAMEHHHQEQQHEHQHCEHAHDASVMDDWALVLGSLHRIYDPDTRDSVLSHITIFEAVYRIVGAGRGSELFDRICEEVLARRCAAVCEFLGKQLDVPCGQFLECFAYCGRNYKKSTQISQTVLRHLENMILKAKLFTDFDTEAFDLYHERVIRDKRLHTKLKSSLKEAAATPLAVDPSVLMCITQGLNKFNPRYLEDLPELRKRFIVRERGYVNPGCIPQLSSMEREAMNEVERAYRMLGYDSDSASCVSDDPNPRKRAYTSETDEEEEDDSGDGADGTDDDDEVVVVVGGGDGADHSEQQLLVHDEQEQHHQHDRLEEDEHKGGDMHTRDDGDACARRSSSWVSRSHPVPMNVDED